MRTLSNPPGTSGFTLIELLVSLTIFGMLSAAGVLLLSFSVKAQGAATERLDDLAQVRRAGALLTADLAQAAPRVARDATGAVEPAFVGSSGQGLLLSLVRRGWENLDGANRSSLQKVQYRLAGDRIERIGYPHVDGALALPPATVMNGVRQVTIRYRDVRGDWRQTWDPVQPFLLPDAVELIVDTEASGQVRQLFLVGTAG